MRTPKRRSRAKQAAGLIKLSIRLPVERAKLLRGYCAIHGLELGQVIDWGLDHAMGGFYFACRGPRLSPAVEPPVEPESVPA